MAEIVQNLFGKADLLIVFIGMAALLWRIVRALDDTTQILARILSGQPLPQNIKLSHVEMPQPVPQPAPVQPLPNPAPQLPSPPPQISHKAIVVNEAFINAVKSFEGFMPKAQWDFKQWTNGYGTKARSKDEAITKTEADQRLRAELGACYDTVDAFVPPGCPIGVEQALMSLSFNVGAHDWMQAGLGAAVKASDWAKAKGILLQYCHVHKDGKLVELEDLVKRRKAESIWFDHPLLTLGDHND